MAKITAKEKEQTRERILIASRKVFRETGFSKTQIKFIAKEAGVGVSTIYGYYPSKGELFVSAFIDLYMTQSLDTDKILGVLERGLSKGLSELLIRQRGLNFETDRFLIRDFYIKSLSDDRCKIENRRYDNRALEYEFVKRVLEIYERTNMRLCTFSLNNLAACVVTIVDHNGIEYLLLEEHSLKEVEEKILEQLDVLFAGKYEKY